MLSEQVVCVRVIYPYVGKGGEIWQLEASSTLPSVHYGIQYKVKNKREDDPERTG